MRVHAQCSDAIKELVVALLEEVLYRPCCEVPLGHHRTPVFQQSGHHRLDFLLCIHALSAVHLQHPNASHCNAAATHIKKCCE